MSSSTKRNFIVAAIMLLVCVGAEGIAFWQIKSQATTLKKQIEVLEAQGNQAAALMRLEKIADTSSEDRKEIANYFLDRESNSIDFLTMVEQLAPQEGVALETEKLEAISIKKNAPPDWVEATFSFTGDRADVERFVQLLENISYVSELRSVTLEAQSSTLWKSVVQVRVRILSYDENK